MWAIYHSKRSHRKNRELIIKKGKDKLRKTKGGHKRMVGRPPKQ